MPFLIIAFITCLYRYICCAICSNSQTVFCCDDFGIKIIADVKGRKDLKCNSARICAAPWTVSGNIRRIIACCIKGIGLSGRDILSNNPASVTIDSNRKTGSVVSAAGKGYAPAGWDLTLRHFDPDVIRNRTIRQLPRCGIASRTREWTDIHFSSPANLTITVTISFAEVNSISDTSYNHNPMTPCRIRIRSKVMYYITFFAVPSTGGSPIYAIWTISVIG